MPASATQLARVGGLLRGAPLWGLELEPRYRVLAATVEPDPAAHPDGDVPDRRLQLVFYPVGSIRARLEHRPVGQRPVVEMFTVEQLPAVVEAFEGARAVGDPFDAPEPDWPGPHSLEGVSNAPDGHTHRLLLTLERNDRRLGLLATFDEVTARRPDGSEVA